MKQALFDIRSHDYYSIRGVATTTIVSFPPLLSNHLEEANDMVWGLFAS